MQVVPLPRAVMSRLAERGQSGRVCRTSLDHHDLWATPAGDSQHLVSAGAQRPGDMLACGSPCCASSQGLCNGCCQEWARAHKLTYSLTWLHTFCSLAHTISRWLPLWSNQAAFATTYLEASFSCAPSCSEKSAHRRHKGSAAATTVGKPTL